jgi:hypothetical protein
MNKRFNNKNQMFRSVEKVWDNNRQIWESSPVFTDVYNEVTGLVRQINPVNIAATVSTSGITDDKNSLKAELAEEDYRIASAIYFYASRTGNATLRAKVDYTENDLGDARQDNLVKMTKNIADTAEEYLSELAPQGIVAEDIEALRLLADRYEKAIPEGRATVADRMVSGEKLAELIAQTEDLLKHQADRLMEQYRKPNPDFYNAYFNARIVIDYGTRHEKKEEPNRPLPEK